jgi:YbbR domain-containing protein
MAELVEVSTAPIDLATITGSEEREVALDLLGTGLEAADSAARVRITVEGVSANFKIKNVALKVLSRHRSQVEPATVTALVRASPGDLRKLDRAKVYGEIRAQGRGKGTSDEPVHIVLPPNVNLVRVIPDTVKLTLY